MSCAWDQMELVLIVVSDVHREKIRRERSGGLVPGEGVKGMSSCFVLGVSSGSAAEDGFHGRRVVAQEQGVARAWDPCAMYWVK